MPKYLIQFTRQESTAIVEYDEQGGIIYLEMNYGTMDVGQRQFFTQNFPVTLERLEYYKTMKNVKVVDVPFDTSFDNFYNTYANKFGNKQRCVRLWESMSDEDRIKAIKYIQTYNRWLVMNSGVQKKLPETYLNQQPWNN